MGKHKGTFQIIIYKFLNLPLITHRQEFNQNTVKLSIFVSLFLLFVILISVITGCSASSRFTSEEKNSDSRRDESITNDPEGETGEIFPGEISLGFIRVLLDQSASEKTIATYNSIQLFSSEGRIAVINRNNNINLRTDGALIELSVQGKIFSSRDFTLTTVEGNDYIHIDGKRYRGRVKIIVDNEKINLVNQVSIEDYVKGVMTKEMPVGSGNENYAALKAFSICVRTYAMTKLFKRNSFYDILPDTRDQVYGGVDGEHELTNRIVDETKSQILTYGNEPAVIFYHSTCGGQTESGHNVFAKADYPYLRGIRDGNPPYCEISPRFRWTENIPGYKIVEGLFSAGYIENRDYNLRKLDIKSRFDSGRINELEILLTGKNSREKTVRLFGNNIRYVLRSSGNGSILRSNNFEIKLSENKTVVLNGRGNGHGVGLCQWGSIGMSRKGHSYKEIINHYFPGTEIKLINEQ